MPAARGPASADDLDDLDDLMNRMDSASLSRPSSSHSTSSRPARPLSMAFPTRTSSRASSHSRLSTQSSSRSLQSLASASSGHSLSPSAALAPSSPPPPLPTSVSGARFHQTSSAPISVGAGQAPWDGPVEDNEITPSMAQGEWSQAPSSASLRSYSRQHQYGDESSSLHSLDRPTSPQIRSHPPSPHLATQRSPSPSRYTSPLRLIPRSPLNERTPLEDLAFFSEMDAAPEDPWDAPRGTDTDSLSVMSGSTGTGGRPRTPSSRSMRLREDIEKTAERLRAKASREELERPPMETRESRGSKGSSASGSPSIASSGLPLYPGAPQPTTYRTSIDDGAEVQSIASVRSAESSPSMAGGAWPASSSASIAAREERDRDRESLRPRQKELKEWSQTCWVWQRDGKAGSGGLLSKAPLIREVPGAMKRKMTSKRESSQLLSPAEALLYGMDDGKGKSSRAKEKEREKAAVATGPNGTNKDGSWRKVTSVLRDDGYFRVFSEEKVILHSVHLPSCPRTDIRLVDHSLFDRPNCVVIYRRAQAPSTPFQPTFNPRTFSSTSSYASSSPSSSNGHGSSSRQPAVPAEEPLYLCMPSIVAMETWIVMAHCFARPEFFVSTGATTPRPMRRGSLNTASTGRASSNGHYGGDDGLPQNSDDEEMLGEHETGMADDTRYRIFRSLTIAINEGKGLGEMGVEVIRDRPKLSSEGWRGTERDGSSSTAGSTYEGFAADSPSKPGLPIPKMPARTDSSNSTKDEQTVNTFCEVALGGDVLARTSTRKGTNSPFWNETFTFNDLPPFLEPLTIRIFQTHKNSRPTLLGVCTIRLPDLPRSELIESWWSVRSPTWDVRSRSTETIGELSLGVKVGEEVVLPSGEYRPILQLLIDDSDAELPTDIAHEFPSDLEEMSRLLLRIYQSESLLIPRIFRLVELEVETSTKSAAILFRGNTILTKSTELYVRRVGREYLDASIGDIVRKLCAEKVEIEIDPSRMKPGTKDKELQHNVQDLHDWSLAMWNSIYDAREKCPDNVRQIFGHIQRVVGERYGEEHKNTRWTSVSAFIFLRFFVPAVLNPKLFGLVAIPPDPKSQRALTLVAKTLQGLANFAAFGQKEPWMLPMNSFVQDNTSAFVDFIEHISRPAPPSASRQEWTSPSAAVYIAPYRLRSSLPPLVREGVPLVPHLIDLPRNLGLLAAHIAKGVVEKGPPPLIEGRGDSPSIASSRGRSAKFTDLAEACIDVHEEARRRGGGLVPPLFATAREGKSRARAATVRTTNAWARKSTLGTPSAPPAAPSTPPRGSPLSEDVMHIRAPSTPPNALGGTAAAGMRSPQSERGSLASRRSHRSFTINGASPSIVRASGALRSLSSDDLTLSSIASAPTDVDDAPPTAFTTNGERPQPPLPCLPPLSGAADSIYSIPSDADVFTDADSFAENPTAAAADRDLDLDEPAFSPTTLAPPVPDSSYSFPARRAKVPINVTQSTTTSWAIVPEEELASGLAGGSGGVDEESSTYESSFSMPFSVPMQSSNSASSWASIPSSTSSRSIIAEVSVGGSHGMARRPSLPTPTGSSTDLFGLGKEHKSGKGFFSRRKNSKAS
ncbi:hypothetical protein BCR35DRAFT_300543 [Leucosporidium creatinivorum]|uniref:Ras-GAP domain-containing protein n=1 Tax=Leucosporidium creatinivorum TaxID=106004 RepID=A0A1Y2G0I9_9BASI|nr:hypothetical protein BCR35DRAFT_300543 [Leucosporidium creatinivorum]